MLKPGLVAVERSKGTPDAVLKEIQAGKRRHFFRVCTAEAGRDPVWAKAWSCFVDMARCAQTLCPVPVPKPTRKPLACPR